MDITTLDLNQEALYALAANLEDSVLLNSCGSVLLGRYTIFTALPCDECDSIDALASTAKNSRLDLAETGRDIPRLPFTSGWIGIYAYTSELKARYYTWSYVYDRREKQGYLAFSDECPDSKRTVVLSSIELAKKQMHLEHKKETPKRAFNTLSWNKSQTKDQYFNSFSKLQNYILSGDCYQANLTQRFEADCSWSKLELVEAYAQACKNSNANFCAFIDLGNDDAIVSISPEQFIHCQDRIITTKPIKGTVKSSGQLTAPQRLELQNSKNKAENLMIVDLLRNDLSKVSQLNSVQVARLFSIESYENVHHLVSTISSTLQETFSPLDAFIEAFPGGSITGAPKKRAMEIIEELELHSRMSYCGSVFYIDEQGNLDSNILIRTIQKQGEKAYCWGGGGIVADSNMESEYQESIDKVRHLTGIDE